MQIEYLHIAGHYQYSLPNFLRRKCLKKNTSGETEYDFEEESYVQSLADLSCVNVKKKKKKWHFEDTPQGGARRKRQWTSTPKGKMGVNV